MHELLLQRTLVGNKPYSSARVPLGVEATLMKYLTNAKNLQAASSSLIKSDIPRKIITLFLQRVRQDSVINN